MNTHLAGDELFLPSWHDYPRADDIADWFGGDNPRPDVVAFQEIWDEDLFFGRDGANGIRPRSGYPYGDHGQIEGDILKPLRSIRVSMLSLSVTWRYHA